MKTTRGLVEGLAEASLSIDCQSDQEVLQRLLELNHEPIEARLFSMALLAEFGGLDSVFTASEARIRMISGVEQKLLDLLQILRSLRSRAVMDQNCRIKPIKDVKQVFEYALSSMAHLPVAHLKVMYLDRLRELIGVETLQTGDFQYVEIGTREIIGRALDLSARYLIILQNQQDEMIDPSYETLTRLSELEAAGRKLWIDLLDYILITPYMCVSFQELGFLAGKKPPLQLAQDLPD